MATMNLEVSDKPTEAAPKVQHWMGEVAEALKREKDWRKEAKEVTCLYEGDSKRDDQFNILYSNTETLAPALMNSTPRPRVRRRFLDADPVGKVAAKVTERALEFLLDSDQRDYTPFNSLMEEAVLGGLVPGRGVTRFKYDADIKQIPAEGEEDSEDYVPATEELTYETICGETVPWNRFLHGFAKKWQNVPWVGFEWPMTLPELKKNFGDEIALKCELVDIEGENLEGEERDSGKRMTDTSTKGAWVYEIWDKESRKVYFVSSSYKEEFLKEVDDPLQLSGFFPCPEPLRVTRRLDGLLPIPLYKYYEEQAKELNRVTVRINKLIGALKNRGFYDSTLEGIDKLMQADDNTLIPAENVAAMLQGQTLDKAIFLMPIEKLIAVLQQLYAQRQQVKQVIYEITGIADIMRGSSQASETLGAQQIKNQWGTLRLKYAQGKVKNYVRESLRIMAEIAVTKLSPETLSAMTGIVLPTEEQKQLVQQQIQQATAGQAQMNPGQPPQPPQLPPQVQEMLAKPTVEQVMQVLQHDLLRQYKVDIEINSTIEEEVAEDKSDMAEMMNALGQFMNGIGPLVTQGAIPFEVAKALLMGIIRRFRFGGDVEELLEAMMPPQPAQPEEKGESPEVVQAKAQGAITLEQAKQQSTQLDMQFKAAEHQMKMQELELKGQLAQADFQAQMERIRADMAKSAQAAVIAQNAPKPTGVSKNNARGK